ncbi:MAG: TetR/AcrR family transcriptional regulator [Saccharospirillaceae bacterium]|nr:TetR/AcrR family transcriptional regulator [Pseudomonadales bacterium]NRB80451.1 TetR/AcrR family transcriptional regulator [Saccharospirillaceae bacterium]
MTLIYEPERFKNESRTKRSKRQILLTKAEEIFRTKGIASTSMIDIAKIAEVERRTLYNYYNNKEEMAIDIQIEYLRNYGATVEFKIDYNKDFPEQLEQYCDAYVRRFLNNKDYIIFITQFDYYFRHISNDENLERFHQKMKNRNMTNNPAMEIISLICKQKNINISHDMLKKFFFTLHHCILGVAQRVIFRESVFMEEQNYSSEDILMIIPIIVKGIVATLPSYHSDKD